MAYIKWNFTVACDLRIICFWIFGNVYFGCSGWSILHVNNFELPLTLAIRDTKERARRASVHHHIYKWRFVKLIMASTPPGAQKMKIDYTIDRKIYDDFAKACSRKGFAPQVIVEKLMAKFNQTGQI